MTMWLDSYLIKPYRRLFGRHSDIIFPTYPLISTTASNKRKRHSYAIVREGEKLMGFDKEQLDDLVPRIINHDQEAFQLFYDEYKNVVFKHAFKYIGSLRKSSMGLIDDEDLINDLWEFILNRLKDFDSERAGMTTFLYLLCRTYAERTERYYKARLRHPGHTMNYLDQPVFVTEIAEEMTLLSLLESPVDMIKQVETEIQVFEYVYFIRLLVETFDTKRKMVYMHQLLGMTLEESGRVIGTTRERARQLRVSIQNKIELFYDKIEEIDPKKADRFAVQLMSPLSDDELSETLDCDLAVVMICRQVLRIAEMYDVTGGAAS